MIRAWDSRFLLEEVQMAQGAYDYQSPVLVIGKA
jgi:hypothetical protein